MDTLNAQICKANKPDYFMKSNRGKVSRESESSALVRVTVAKVNENKAYTGLLAFSKQKCGRDFLDGKIVQNGPSLGSIFSRLGSKSEKPYNQMNRLFLMILKHLSV